MYVASTQSVNELEVFVALTSKGIHPLVLSKLNEGIGVGTMQNNFVNVSNPQSFFIIIEIEYSPSVLKFKSKIVDPQLLGLGELRFPVMPFTIVQPWLGTICHSLFEDESHIPELFTVIPLVDKSVNVIVEFTQLTLSGLMLKSAIGFIEVVIGCTVPSEKPH